MGNQKLFDYLNQEANWIALESDMQEIRNIVLEEAGFKWITDKLPEVDMTITRYSDTVLYSTPTKTKVGYYDHTGKWYNEIYGEFELEKVIAWMPLPKPYNP